jgi:hypothetical protein
MMAGAVLAAIEVAILFDAVTNDRTATMGASGSEGLDGALEAVKRVGFAIHDDFECFFVVVAAGFTDFHKHPFFPGSAAKPPSIHLAAQRQTPQSGAGARGRRVEGDVKAGLFAPFDGSFDEDLLGLQPFLEAVAFRTTILKVLVVSQHHNLLLGGPVL